MAITVVKDKADKAKKKSKKGKTKKAVEGIIAKINELGDIYKVMKPVADALKDHQKDWKPVFSEVQDFVDTDNAADKEVTVKTDKYAATFTPHGNMSKCSDPKKAYNMLNKVQAGLGVELMTFPVGELKKYLTPAQMEQVVTMERSKARSVTVVDLSDE